MATVSNSYTQQSIADDIRAMNAEQLKDFKRFNDGKSLGSVKILGIVK